MVRVAVLAAVTGALACGGGGGADEKGAADAETGTAAGSQAPGMGQGDAVNAEGTADTEAFSHNPDTATGSPAGGGAAPGSQPPAPTPP